MTEGPGVEIPDAPEELTAALARRGAKVVGAETERGRTYVRAVVPGGGLFARFSSARIDEAFLAHEAAVRELIGSTGQLRTPPVLERGRDWMIEPLLKPGAVRGPEAVRAVVDAVADLALRSLPESPQSSARASLAAALRRRTRLVVRPQWGREVMRSRRALAGVSLPRVTSHGDLHAGNLLHDDPEAARGPGGAPWVIDWEMSALRPAGWDLMQLWSMLGDEVDREVLFESTVELVGKDKRRDLAVLRYVLLVQTIAAKFRTDEQVGDAAPPVESLFALLAAVRREAGA